MLPGLLFTAVLPRRRCQLCHSLEDGARGLCCRISQMALGWVGLVGAEAVCLPSHLDKLVQQACVLVRCERFRGLDGCAGRGSSSYRFDRWSLLCLLDRGTDRCVCWVGAHHCICSVGARRWICSVDTHHCACLINCKRIKTMQRSPHERNRGSEIVRSLSHAQRRSIASTDGRCIERGRRFIKDPGRPNVPHSS
ncbi:hypothetical protein BST61_g11133 [Cercospora zeina]